jgi:hypothetical protein
MKEQLLPSSTAFKRFVYILVAVGVLVSVLIFVFLSHSSRKSKAALGDFVSVTFSPAVVYINSTNPTSTVQFETSNRPVAVQGYNIKYVFDTSKIQVTSVQYLVGVASAGLGQTNTDLATINASGTLNLVGEVNSPSPQLLQLGTQIAKIGFKSIDQSLTTSSVTVSGTFYAVNGDNTISAIPMTTNAFTVAGANVTVTVNPSAVPSVSPSVTPSTGNTALNMKLRLQGITTAPKNTASLPFLVKVAGANGQVGLGTVNFTPDANGIYSGTLNFNVPTVSTGSATPTYSVYIKGPKHLKKRICNSQPTESTPGSYACATDKITLTPGGQNTLDMSAIYQMVGDLKVDNGQQNGIVDSSDTSYIRTHFGSTDASALDIADLNMDGIVDTQDFSLVIAALNVKYDDPEAGQ